MMFKRLRGTSSNRRACIVEIISMLLILLFVYAAVSKIIDHKAFLYTLRKSPILSVYSNIISWMVPLAELFIAVLLIFPAYRGTALFYSGLLMCAFTLYIAYMIVFIPQLPCSCGGILKSMGWRAHLVFNICFTVFAFGGWLLRKRTKILLQ